MTITVTAQIQLRKGTAAQWTSANPVLASGEVGYETDTGKQKIGDGTTVWMALAYYYNPNGTVDHGALIGLGDDDHSQYHTDARGDARYAPIAKGVTNGDSHDHSGGDGGQIAYSALSGLPTLGTAAATASTDYAVATHNHSGVYLPVGTDAADLTSGSATDNYVLTADGLGGAAWEAAEVTYAGAASETHAATSKTTPVDADELPLVDSAASWVLKKLSWGSLVARIKTALTYFKDSTNFSMGSNSFANLTTGTENISIGYNSLSANTSGYLNLAVGGNALSANTSGYLNLAVGGNALSANTSGVGNVAIGYNALTKNQSGGDLIAIGINTLANSVSAGENIAIGANALSQNTSGGMNTSIGKNSLIENLSAYGNTAIGYNSLKNNTGYYNTSIGVDSFINHTLGDDNVVIGHNAGRFHADGSTALTTSIVSVYIGAGARGKNNSDYNAVVIGGNTSIGLGANTTVLGTSNTTLTRLYGDVATGIDSPSAAFHAVKTTEQLRLGYDASNYASFTVSSTGNLTIDTVGNTIYIPDTIENTTNGAGIVLKSPDGTRYRITVANGGTLSVATA